MRRLLLLLLSSPFLFSLTHSFHHRSIHFPSQAAKEVLSTYTKKKSNNGSREEGCECFLFPSSFRSAIEEADRWGDACRGLVGPNQPFRAASLLAATPGGLGRSRSRMQRDIEQGDGNSESQTRDGFLSARPPKKTRKTEKPNPPLFPPLSFSFSPAAPPSIQTKRNRTKPNQTTSFSTTEKVPGEHQLQAGARRQVRQVHPGPQDHAQVPPRRQGEARDHLEQLPARAQVRDRVLRHALEDGRAPLRRQ